ncbi:chemotaxis protein CheD [Methyloversatilis sp.]|uniref:chemotaxis protein CheD n=1 Tax=Methyloversatilis sp. TaxID=2569862 RepID=UPI0035B47B76
MTAGERPELHLNPGQIVVAGGGQRIHTLLGSCVAVTVWHPPSARGGICHALLPERGDASRFGPGYFVDEAMDELLRELLWRAPMTELQFKVFGGGRLFGDEAGDGSSIGERNVRRVRDHLAAFGVRPVSEHCGGRGWRTLTFDLADGRVHLRYSAQGAGSMEWNG